VHDPKAAAEQRQHEAAMAAEKAAVPAFMREQGGEEEL